MSQIKQRVGQSVNFIVVLQYMTVWQQQDEERLLTLSHINIGAKKIFNKKCEVVEFKVEKNNSLPDLTSLFTL